MKNSQKYIQLKNELFIDLETADLHQERVHEFQNEDEKSEYIQIFNKFFNLKFFFERFFKVIEGEIIFKNEIPIEYETMFILRKENVKRICLYNEEDPKFTYSKNSILKYYKKMNESSSLIFKYFNFLLPNHKYVNVDANLNFLVRSPKEGNSNCTNFPISIIKNFYDTYLENFKNIQIFKISKRKSFLLNSETKYTYFHNECLLFLRFKFQSLKDDIFYFNQRDE